MCLLSQHIFIGNNMEDFIIVRQFADKETCAKLVERLDDFHAKGIVLPPDNQCPTSPSFYGIFNDESTLWLPKIEELVGKKLFPTYTYSRIYTPGEILLPHIDRSECEYSFSLALKYDEEIWPLCIESNGMAQEIYLDVGDILIYKGPEQKHWRMPLDGKFHYQGFFHYVDQEGLYANLKYDGRATFATTEEAAQETIRRKHA